MLLHTPAKLHRKGKRLVEVRDSIGEKKVGLKRNRSLRAVEARCEQGGEHSESTSSPVGAETVM